MNERTFLLLRVLFSLLLWRQSTAFTASSSYNNGDNSPVWCRPYQATTSSQQSKSRHSKQPCPFFSYTATTETTTTTIRRGNRLPRHTHLSALPESNMMMDVMSSLFQRDGQVPLVISLGWNVGLFFALRTKLLQVLTPEGFFHSLALGSMLWHTLGWRGWTLCVLYLALGSLVTKIKFEEKQNLGIAEGRGGRRGPENVWGSAATGLLCAVGSIQGPVWLGIPSQLYILGYVSSLATKLADTFASEIGKAYGKTTFLITTLERVEPGTEGAISLEGTVASIVGGSLLTLYGWSVGLIGTKAIPISILAAFVATNLESWLGATLQGKDDWKWMTNEVINFLNTLIGAILAIVAGMVLL